jgi:hypothetical protein
MVKRFRRVGIWDIKSDALEHAISLKKSGIYNTKIKKISYPSDRKQKGFAVYRMSK